jgi:hypothetical protein
VALESLDRGGSNRSVAYSQTSSISSPCSSTQSVRSNRAVEGLTAYGSTPGRSSGASGTCAKNTWKIGCLAWSRSGCSSAHEAFERRVLVGECVEHDIARLSDELGEGQVVAEIAAEHNRVGKQADGVVQLGSLATRCRRPTAIVSDRCTGTSRRSKTERSVANGVAPAERLKARIAAAFDSGVRCVAPRKRGRRGVGGRGEVERHRHPSSRSASERPSHREPECRVAR